MADFYTLRIIFADIKGNFTVDDFKMAATIRTVPSYGSVITISL